MSGRGHPGHARGCVGISAEANQKFVTLSKILALNPGNTIFPALSCGNPHSFWINLQKGCLCVDVSICWTISVLWKGTKRAHQPVNWSVTEVWRFISFLFAVITHLPRFIAPRNITFQNELLLTDVLEFYAKIGLVQFSRREDRPDYH